MPSSQALHKEAWAVQGREQACSYAPSPLTCVLSLLPNTEVQGSLKLLGGWAHQETP